MQRGLKLFLGVLLVTAAIGGIAYAATHKAGHESKQMDVKQNEWLLCANDDDCAVVDSACPGFFWSVNVKYVADNAAQNDRIRPLIECGPPPNNIRPLRPKCQAQQCVMPRQP